MKEGKPDVSVMDHQNQKPLKYNQIGTHFKSWLAKQKQKPLKYNQIGTHFKSWLAKQPLPVEAAVVSVTNAVQGAAICSLFAILHQSHAPDFARVCGVGKGVSAGVSCVLRRLRGKEDVYSSMVSGFGCGAIGSLVSGVGKGTQQASFAAVHGVAWALLHAGYYKVMEANERVSKLEEDVKADEKFVKARMEDTLYNETRGMLTSLGLEHYIKNLKRGLLTDTTLPLLTHSVLKEVMIPPGPRLLIVDHIKREKGVKKGGDIDD